MQWMALIAEGILTGSYDSTQQTRSTHHLATLLWLHQELDMINHSTLDFLWKLKRTQNWSQCAGTKTVHGDWFPPYPSHPTPVVKSLDVKTWPRKEEASKARGSSATAWLFYKALHLNSMHISTWVAAQPSTVELSCHNTMVVKEESNHCHSKEKTTTKGRLLGISFKTNTVAQNICNIKHM